MERQRGRAHPQAAIAVAQECADGGHEGRGVGHFQRRARVQCIARCFREIEHVRPDECRPADGDRLDQVLPAQRQQAATDERDVGHRVVSRQFAHRIAEHHRDVCRHRCVVAAADERHAAAREEFRHSGKALRVARHDDHHGFGRQRTGGERIENQRFLAFASRAGDPHRARVADAHLELAAERHGGLGDGDIELEIAGDDRRWRPEHGQPAGVVRRLRGNAGKCREHRPRERRDARVARRRSLRQPRVDEEERHVRSIRQRDDVRPQLGFQYQARTWLPVREESTYRERHIVRQPGLNDAIADQRTAGSTTGCRHVREQDRGIGKRALDPLDKRACSSRLAERNRVHPEHRSTRAAVAAVASVALADALAIAGLAAPAPPQAKREERQRDIPEQRVERANQVDPPSAARRPAHECAGCALDLSDRRHGPDPAEVARARACAFDAGKPRVRRDEQ